MGGEDADSSGSGRLAGDSGGGSDESAEGPTKKKKKKKKNKPETDLDKKKAEARKKFKEAKKGGRIRVNGMVELWNRFFGDKIGEEDEDASFLEEKEEKANLWERMLEK